MIFITLERPDVYNDVAITKNSVKRSVIKQKPITINPDYIVSMLECFNSSKEFESTELYLSNGVWYHVTSRIEEIVEMINGGKESSCSHVPEAEDKHDCCFWDFGRHECGFGLDDCPNNDKCDFFD